MDSKDQIEQENNKSTGEIISQLYALSSKAHKEGMSSFGIPASDALGVPVPKIRGLARKIGKNHEIALQLWESGIHEARILAAMVADPAKLSREDMDNMVSEIDSWDICDNACGELFLKTQVWDRKIHEWASCDQEFVRRAGFALIAYAVVHRKEVKDAHFESYLPLIEEQACDGRKYVRKAVEWALRQIGKRSLHLNSEAVKTATLLQGKKCKAARTTGSAAIRELQSERVIKRLTRKNKKR